MCGYWWKKVGEAGVKMLLYADDAVVLAESEE
jgi:hypothetical protein